MLYNGSFWSCKKILYCLGSSNLVHKTLSMLKVLIFFLMRVTLDFKPAIFFSYTRPKLKENVGYINLNLKLNIYPGNGEHSSE